MTTQTKEINQSWITIVFNQKKNEDMTIYKSLKDYCEQNNTNRSKFLKQAVAEKLARSGHI